VLLLSKILSLLVYPLSLCLLLLVLAMLMRMRGATGRANGLTLLATMWLYFCATDWGATALLTPLEAAYPAFSDEELPTAEAIVVLGGAITGESRFGQGGDLNQAADRLWRAASLYQSHKAPLLVLSGGSTLSSGLPESEMMAQKLRALGIPDAVLMQEAESRTTRENGQYTGALLERQRINHILLVTSASHMRRASAVFAAQGFIVTAVSTDHQIPLLVGPVPGWLPTAERLSRSTRAIHEWVGYQVYSWLGYLERSQAENQA
tara:strand:- start:411 stop:1202 length:792 start_codon:yes stop_codon:yes gene_type:complete